MSNPNPKLATATVAKATTRGAASSSLWITILWWIAVDQLRWLDETDTTSLVVVGAVATVLTGTFRALERRWPWFGVLLLSQERPAYGGELEALAQAAPSPLPAPTPDPVAPTPADPPEMPPPLFAVPPGPPDNFDDLDELEGH